MESLYILVPLSVAIVFLIGLVFRSSLEGGQFDDLDKPGVDVLMDDDRPRADLDAGQNAAPPAP